MNQRVFRWSLTSALAGFLFGFDTVVISGAEKTIQDLWSLGDIQHGLAMSAALWGTVIGSLVGGWPTDKFGRTKTLLWIGILYFVSAVWSGLANDVYSFMVARFIGGLGVGISTVAAPLYISEIAPPAQRGRLAGMFQFNIVFGILIAFLSNYLIGKYVSSDGWRWMLGIEALPALVYAVLCLRLPQSPRWLITQRNDRESAMRVLSQINPDATETDIAALADGIEKASTVDPNSNPSGDSFWSSRLRTPILLAFFVAFFNQLSGINAILYFAPRIFQLAGLGENAALLNSIGIGVTNLLFTFLGLYLIDRLGRRTLLSIGTVGYVVSLGVCAYVFFAFSVPFQVANSAMALQSASDQRAAVIAKMPVSAGELERADRDLYSAKVAFDLATALPGYDGQATELSSKTSLGSDEVEAFTSAALSTAAESSGAAGNIVLLCIFGFIAAHAVGQGAVIWVLISEVFPNKHRAAGQALGSFTHWIFAAMLTMVFPWMIGTFATGYVFGFFCFMMVLQGVWIATMVPETKGVPLEEMEAKLGIRL